ncbi:MAG: CRISPR-associated endoribonuclease Cas6 [Aphanothece sp. CMT-3BRIN-NPC111]|nr:CRISPR-associated endoribonuclease Cas6 [Aphanothece sp. CMT-3BRIN-NPC111]
MSRITQGTSKGKRSLTSNLSWSSETELVGLVFDLVPQVDASLYPQYAIGLHAWFLDQVRQSDPDLSAYLHDGESEKPFTLSELDGPIKTSGRQLQLQAWETYRWYVTGLQRRVVEWLAQWVKNLPEAIELRNARLQIRSCAIALPATTYAQLFDTQQGKTVTLSFSSATSFRRKGHHLPLPWPVNVFHSYLRRWNHFSDLPFDQDAFLGWVDDGVLINRHRLESVKVSAGKKGSVTGFTGAIEFGLTKSAQSQAQFQQLFLTLGQLAPYCGTGHKTTFGLGQTRWGWLSIDAPPVPEISSLLAQRIAQLTETFVAQRQRTGGDRALEIAETWATILARRELGESLMAIATDLEMPYETVKTYAKLSRRALKESE